jgi:GH25 family lysozyme M1 (1,4-beta-N-acetylmuramidase)
MRLISQLSLRGTLALLITAGLATAGLAGATQAAAAPVGSPQPVNHSNVGSPHSPELLKRLAGPSASGARAAAMRQAVITGAAQGVDVASFQHPNGDAIDWASVAGAGKTFAAIKGTEGAYYRNPYLYPTTKDPVGDLAGAQAAGLSVIAYAFGIPNGNGSSSSAKTQADYLLSYLGASSATVPVMLDIEYNPYGAECYGLTQSAMVTWIKAFSNEVITSTGRPPILYSTQDWLSTCTGNSTALGGDPLWIAHYTTASSPAPLPASWTDWGLWQYTSTGTVSGIATTGHTDLDQISPNSFIDAGKLLAFSPGYQTGPAGTAVTPPVPVTTYPEETGPAVSFSPTTLPAGLTLDTATGGIGGTVPTTTGSYPVKITVSDATSGASGPVSFTWYSTGHLSVTSPGSKSTVAGTPVDFQVAAADSVSAPPVKFTAGGLPPGVSISATGLVTGWPDTPGTYHATVTATDSLKSSGSASFTWTVTAASATGPVGPARLDVGGTCLNDVGNKSANGNQLDIWTCNGSTAQRWTYVQDGTVRIHGKCLTAPGTAGWKVRLQPCTGAAAGQWLLVYPRAVNSAAGQTPITLVNPATGWCLEDPGRSTANGTRVVAASCNGYKDQAWTLPAGPITAQIPGRCADDSRSKTTNGTTIDLWSCNGTAAQQWTAEPDGTVRVRGRCLDVRASATVSGSPVDLWSCNGSGAQQWQLAPSGAGVSLVNPQSGLCLTDPGNVSTKGTGLQISTCAGEPGQVWRAR